MSELLRVCKIQHTTIDILMAMLIESKPEFMPSKSGKPWEAFLAGNDIIEKRTSKFIFIAYKPSSEDYCRNCLMASYSSDHEIYSDLDEEELIKKWADYLYQNMDLGCGEAGYEFWLFMDGTPVLRESYYCYYYDCEEDINLEHDDTKEVTEFITRLEEKAKSLAGARKNKIVEEEKEAKEKKRIKEETERGIKRRIKYEKLKEEFGMDVPS